MIEIQQWTFNGETDRGLVADRFAITRKFSWGNDWQKIYVGFLLSREDDWPTCDENARGTFGVISSDGTTYQNAQYAVVPDPINGLYCYYNTYISEFYILSSTSGKTKNMHFLQNGSVVIDFQAPARPHLWLPSNRRMPLVWKFERTQGGFYYGFLYLDGDVNANNDFNFDYLMETIDLGDEEYIKSRFSSDIETYGPFALPDDVILDALHYYHYYPDRRLRILGAFASKWA